MANVPVTFYTELNTPPTEWAISEDVPSSTPIPNYKGPLTSPYAGFTANAFAPVAIFLNKFMGLPIIFKDPNILYICFKVEL